MKKILILLILVLPLVSAFKINTSTVWYQNTVQTIEPNENITFVDSILTIKDFNNNIVYSDLNKKQYTIKVPEITGNYIVYLKVFDGNKIYSDTKIIEIKENKKFKFFSNMDNWQKIAIFGFVCLIMVASIFAYGVIKLGITLRKS